MSAAKQAAHSKLVVMLYRQIMRSTRMYAAEAHLRGRRMTPEITRIIAAPSMREAHAAAADAAAAVTPASTAASLPNASTSPSALNRHMESWLKQKPFLFQHVLIAEKKQAHKLQPVKAADSTAESGSQASPPPLTTAPSSVATASASSIIADSAEPAVIADSTKPAATRSSPIASSPAQVAAQGIVAVVAARSANTIDSPSCLDAGSSAATSNDATAAPLPPAWISALNRSGLGARVVDRSLLVALLRRAFKLKVEPASSSSSSSAASSPPDLAGRLSSAFSLDRRLRDRALELQLLPLLPLASWSRAEVPGVLRVELKCLGLFKALKGSHWFHVQWRAWNLSNGPKSVNLVLTARKVVTHQRSPVAASALEAASASPLSNVFASSSDLAPRAPGMAPIGMGNSMGLRLMGATAAVGAAATAGSVGSGGGTSTSIPAATAAAAIMGGVTSSTLSLSPLESAISRLAYPSTPSPASAASAARPSASGVNMGLRIESMGVGLSGRPLALPPGSALAGVRSIVRIEGGLGTMEAAVSFTETGAGGVGQASAAASGAATAAVTAGPAGAAQRSFTIKLPPILLDAAAGNAFDSDEMDAPPEDEPTPFQPPSRHDHRDMLSHAIKAATQAQTKAADAAAPTDESRKPL